MKKLMVAMALMLASGIAAANVCSTEITYTIKDAAGVPVDVTTYVRKWPLTCEQQVEGKYIMLQAVFGKGEARFKSLQGQQ